MVSGGVLFEVDQEKQALGALKFTRCEADGCYIEAIVSEDDLSPLKKGNQAAVAVLSSTGQPRVVGLSLSGFTAAFNEVKEKNQACLLCAGIVELSMNGSTGQTQLNSKTFNKMQASFELSF